MIHLRFTIVKSYVSLIMKCANVFLTSHMQTVQKTWDFLPTGINTGNKRQCRPEEFVTSFGKTQEYYSSVGIQIFYLKNKKENTESSVNTTALLKHSIKLHNVFGKI